MVGVVYLPISSMIVLIYFACGIISNENTFNKVLIDFGSIGVLNKDKSMAANLM